MLFCLRASRKDMRFKEHGSYISLSQLSSWLSSSNSIIFSSLTFSQTGFDQTSVLEGDSQQGARFGSSIANIGDINKDGFQGMIFPFH